MKTGIQNPHAAELVKELAARVADKGKGVRENFTKELQKINPRLDKLLQFIQEAGWFFGDQPIVPLPRVDEWEGEADERGLPKDAQLSQQLLEEAKTKAYVSWLEGLRNGAYDPDNSEAEGRPEPEPEPEAEEIDMAALARKKAAEANQPKPSVDEVVDQPEPSLPPIKDVLGDAPAKPSLGTPSTRASKVEANLLNALYEYIASTDSPPEDREDDADVIERLDRLEEKLDGVITKYREIEDKLSILNKLKGMFS